MTDKLHDPEKPAGWIRKVGEDGVAIRNDGKELQPAARNPWYVLMTVHGEQDAGGIDLALNAKNRRIWNGWACSKMSVDERATLAEKLDLPAKDLEPWSDEERKQVEQAFEKRRPDLATGWGQGETRGGGAPKPPAGATAVAELPNPGSTIDLHEIYFCNQIYLLKWVFPGTAD
ncbi:MAG: hypothetical protein ACR2O1_05605, partial [Boseongicola sp.]